MPDQTETEVIGDLAIAAMAPFNAPTPEDGEGAPLVLVPDGYSVASLEQFLPRPLRQKAKATFNDTESFCRYLNQFKRDTTQLFASQTRNSVTAIIDYHEADGPAGNGEHTAVLTLEQSPEWLAWIQQDRQWLPQLRFAEFLEDRLADVAEPDGGFLLEVCQHLEAKRTVKFSSGVNLANGAVQLTYDEQVEGKGKGAVTVPTQFILGLAPYRNGDKFRINARLRYRIHDEKLTFAFCLNDPQKVLDQAFRDVLAHVAGETEIEPLLGSASVG
jgi:uncharacterized protein YfdQ (DUF2303 family)